ncbi:hypothetical protein SAMN05216532_4024 [Streptomyces sp. 2231.1]|uniref:hypothetical protein n=1 Tax=Streptomyces sp. 2231.1 TaxID=1855347 RepID=UPI00089C5EF9|nr:hypothetical protein [Streptomyces sp. 2231.1]SED27286.1 hypothetical protein SAMN05216532_4024 [Streptomyces sp. 2231.1]
MTFAPRTWVVGEVVSAATMNQEIRDQFNTFFGAWTVYTPTWTASTTNPSLGNGSITGRYMKIGRSVFVHIQLTMGSTTTFGSGNYNFSLPFAAASTGIADLGLAQLLGTNRWLGQVVLSSAASQCSCFFPTYPSGVADTRSSFLTQVLPESHAAGDQVRIGLFYETAT